MSVTTTGFAALLARVAAIAAEREQELNKADGKLGDGDTGMTLRRVFAKAAEAVASPPADYGDFFKRAGMAASGATGSSLGSLVAFVFLAFGKGYAGRTELSAGDVAAMLGLARETMLARGGAALGDKTVVDMLAAIEEALRGAGDFAGMPKSALAAAETTLDDYRARPNRVGRARMFADRSVGLDDPGMLAVALICRDLAAPTA
ncbi:dihydroxyacetone kinase subunit L [Ancylobacter mangrovi]|uniref:dihydroxyacetone kinase subunit L n=1 Tax=Ancylobacter mangrovi TaxID=2972472 RepID=UPI0021624AC8|nr:dihydroxyacetone kinase subunit L [Ancylobacter mangrovi]MCS0500799.1 dihydroxyacetone kinase subunit L [Ancylobacter mangrovi]